jgi:Type I phosphodiesterase / nucleotide pyrophosphatase
MSCLLSKNVSWFFLLCVWALLASPTVSRAALPRRLILLVDGVSYRDMKALQEGVTYKDLRGREHHRQGFNLGYFPVSRMIGTFPSISDPSWSEILGNQPPPGYQRTYFDAAQNSEISLNGVTTSEEYENQMTWQMGDGFGRFLSYIAPQRAFQYEVSALFKDFLDTQDGPTNYYALIHTTDSAQHLYGDIFAMLCTIDEKLQQLRDIYRTREGRELEILLLSDHGCNHAANGERIPIERFLKKAGYRITTSIRHAKDLVLPTAGIESWVEIHNAPAETQTLVESLSHLEGIDVITASIPNQTNRFLIINSKAERATIDWNPTENSFRYSPQTGDPIDYQPIVEALAKKNALDSNGFASADAWMTETIEHRYPLALERIVRGHTQSVQNPATILVSLKNGYVHNDWIIQRGVVLTTSGGTHGALDDLNSDGILLSSFAPTPDTSSTRVAALFDGFKGRRNLRNENGIEWICAKTLATTTNSIELPDQKSESLTANQLCLRVRTPSFTNIDRDTPIEITIKKIPPVQLRRCDQETVPTFERRLTLTHPLSCTNKCSPERAYTLPADLTLQPRTTYRISAQITNQKQTTPIFSFIFRTNNRGEPMEKGM